MKRWINTALTLVALTILWNLGSSSVHAQATCFYDSAFNTCSTLQDTCIPPLECAAGDCCTQAWIDGGQTQAACPTEIACAIPTPTAPPLPTATVPPLPTATPIPGVPVACQSGYSCQYVPGGSPTCANNLGYDETCTVPNSTDTGNCCLPLTGVYLCSGNGASTCTSDLNVGYTCGTNFGPCIPGDDTCTSCDELSPNSCSPVSAPLPCVEQNDTIGYKCDSTLTGCFPCIDGDTSYGCDPPQYRNEDFGSAEGAFNRCFEVCSGQIPTMFRCDVDLGCIQDGTGSYQGFQECTISCNAPQIFCNKDGEPTAFAEDQQGNKNGLNTAIGCIHVQELPVFTGFLLTFGLGIGGAIALLLIGVAGMLIKFSGGNPERLQAGKELLFAAITGLLLIIFSVYFLRLVGADILGIEQLIATPTPTP